MTKEEKLKKKVDKLEEERDDLAKLLKGRDVAHARFLDRLMVLLELPESANEDGVLRETEGVVRNLKWALTIKETLELLGTVDVRKDPSLSIEETRKLLGAEGGVR